MTMPWKGNLLLTTVSNVNWVGPVHARQSKLQSVTGGRSGSRARLVVILVTRLPLHVGWPRFHVISRELLYRQPHWMFQKVAFAQRR